MSTGAGGQSAGYGLTDFAPRESAQPRVLHESVALLSNAVDLLRSEGRHAYALHAVRVRLVCTTRTELTSAEVLITTAAARTARRTWCAALQLPQTKQLNFTHALLKPYFASAEQLGHCLFCGCSTDAAVSKSKASHAEGPGPPPCRPEPLTYQPPQLIELLLQIALGLRGAATARHLGNLY